MALVTAPADVDAIAQALARAPLVAFDLEFASADRLVPVLCLVQVAWVDHGALDAAGGMIVPHVRLVDPIAVDVLPIVAELAKHALVVAHAPRQDLALLATRFGTGMTGLVDTQLAAAFAGIGEQVGLATLAKEMLGLQLAKDQQWTKWEARPLSDEQLVYADADVRHLPEMYARLAQRLGDRLAWVRDESAEIVKDAIAAATVTPEDAWRGIGGQRGLEPAAQAALQALAAWRMRVASELDRPLGQVLADKVLVELARNRPKGANTIRQVKGLSPLAKELDRPLGQVLADRVLVELARARPSLGGVRSWKGLSPLARTRAEDIANALAAAPAAASPREMSRPASMRAQRWSDMLVTIVQLIAEDTGIAPRLLATRADADEAARVVDEGGLDAARQLPAFSSWRREVLGTAWEGWLTGRLALVGDAKAPHGVRLVAR